MKQERAELLAKLLEEMLEDQHGFFPVEAWLPIHQAFAIPYLEMIIVRRSTNGKAIQFLLTRRTDDYWVGWHIPGSLWRTKKTLKEGVTAVASDELGIKVEIIAKGTWAKWDNHPFGHPISHVVICTTEEEIFEDINTHWFSKVPEGMIDDGGYHVSFIKSALEQIERDHLL